MPRKSTKTKVEAAEAVKEEVTEPKTENIKAEEKVAEVKKEPAKRGRKKAETVSEEKAPVKTEEKKSAGRKAEAACEIHLQFAGKSYTQDGLMKIAKDVWKYDLKQKAGDLKSIELYVKPEESKVYYVMNEFKGSFDI